MNTDMRIVHRDDIPSLRTVLVDGAERNLGILKDFALAPGIDGFIPDQARLAMAWVRLEPGERLEPHVHPIESMIIVAEGHGHTIGDLQEDFTAGDLVLIPRGRHHGFVGAGEQGFWALSVQFELHGLYEDRDNPLVEFDDRALDGALPAQDSLATLLARNHDFVDRHTATPLFDLLRSGRLTEPELRRRFLDVVQTWSTYFQRALYARSAFTDDQPYATLFRDHLDEEFGHDRVLAGGDDGAARVWDPVLHAAASWFATQMLSVDDADKTVLVHLVLEAGAEAIADVGSDALEGATEYFELHRNDAAHRRQGEELLVGLDTRSYSRLLETQQRGWDMLDLLCTRIAALTELPS